jgi:hypothetical protein
MSGLRTLLSAFARPDAERARRALAQSIGIETVVGLCVVFAASLLSNLEPGMHMEHGHITPSLWPLVRVLAKMA